MKAPTDRSRSDCVHEQVAKRIANVRFTQLELLIATDEWLSYRCCGWKLSERTSEKMAGQQSDSGRDCYFGVSKSRPDLLKELNAALEEINNLPFCGEENGKLTGIQMIYRTMIFFVVHSGVWKYNEIGFWITVQNISE